MKKEFRKLCILCVVILAIIGICCLIDKYRRENFVEQLEQEDEDEVHGTPAENSTDVAQGPNHGESNVQGSADVQEGFESPSSCIPKESLMPEELLPQDSGANQWSLSNPQGAGSLKDKNFLQAGYSIGINTVGQTLRNANLQLRSDPPNPQVAVSPWQQSTINPDTNRKPFEIGGCS